MTEQARRNAGNTALVERRLSHPRQWEIAKELTGIGMNGLEHSTDPVLLDQYEIVLIEPVAQPVPAWGEHVEEDPAAEKIGEAWHEKWLLVPDGDLATLKVRGHEELSAIINDKLDGLVEGKGIGQVVMRLMLFTDEARFQHDALATEAAHPMIAAFQTVSGLGGAASLNAIANMRLNWMNRARTIQEGENTASEAIDDATTAAGIKAALDAAAAL